MLPSERAILGWCCPEQPQPWPHLVSSAAGVPRALLGGQRVADVLDGLLSGGGQWSGGASTHRAHRLWSRRCFYFTAARSETTNICQLTATAQKRNYACQLTLSGVSHFRKNCASFQIKSRSSLFLRKSLGRHWMIKYWSLIPIFPLFTGLYPRSCSVVVYIIPRNKVQSLNMKVV